MQMQKSKITDLVEVPNLEGSLLIKERVLEEAVPGGESVVQAPGHGAVGEDELDMCVPDVTHARRSVS